MHLHERTTFGLAAALFLAGLAAGSLGCELIASVDRSQIAGTGGSGGTGGAGGTGGGPECSTPDDCLGEVAGECQLPACDAGLCGTTPVAMGTPTATQTAGDCKENQCLGAATPQSANDDDDIADDRNPCTTDTCAAGTPVHDPAAAGTTCGNGLLCDGNGACVGCVLPSDCPGSDDDCQQRTCEAGVCGQSFTAAGTATGTQTPGDCQENRCDGAGLVVSAALDADLPDDGEDCTDDVCMAGVPSNPPTTAGVTCDQGGGVVCSGTGACVECNVAANCPGADTECQQRTCILHTCGIQDTAAGTAVAMQTPGDCKVDQCDGAGATETVTNNADVNDDSNPCTDDVCTAGVPSNPPVAAGEACGMSGVCDGLGACQGCLTGDDCPGADTECQTRTCTNNTCGFSFAAPGTAVAMQTTGDCKVNQCNGAGMTVSAADNNDKPVDNITCTNDVCTAGVPSNPPASSGTVCNQMGGTVCNGAGSCVQCLLAANCAGTDTECHTRTCIGGACGVSNAASGTVTSTQTAQDCKTNQCDGNGAIVPVNANDPIVDGNQCTNDVCSAGVASNPASASGTACNQMSGTVCNGMSACVQCVMNADCAGQGGGACSMNVCQAPTCSDTLKNGAETDVDCGGGTCGTCATGKTCTVDGDCATGSCQTGVCALLNGCSLATAMDLTGGAGTEITFPNAGLTYDPKCIKVSQGTVVTFTGAFASHPLQGGMVSGGMEIPAASGPFVPATSSGSSAMFTMSTVGPFPYYCIPHGASADMNGVVFVVP